MFASSHRWLDNRNSPLLLLPVFPTPKLWLPEFSCPALYVPAQRHFDVNNAPVMQKVYRRAWSADLDCHHHCCWCLGWSCQCYLAPGCRSQHYLSHYCTYLNDATWSVLVTCIQGTELSETNVAAPWLKSPVLFIPRLKLPCSNNIST